MPRIYIAVAVALAALVTGCAHPQQKATPLAKVSGVKVLLPTPEAPKITGVDCAKESGSVDTLPQRLREAASGALASAGFLIVDDAAAPHDLEAKIDSEVSYCNAAAHIAQGTAGISLFKGGAVVHRSADSGELTSSPGLTELFSDVVSALLRDPAVIASLGARENVTATP